MDTINSKGLWQWRKLVAVHLVVLVGAFLLWLGWPHSFLDEQAFLFCNKVLCKYYPLRVIWACLNHFVTDWIGDGVMFILFVCYIVQLGKKRLKGVAEMVLTALCLVVLVALVNTYLFRHPFKIERKSPSLVFEQVQRVSKEVVWLKVKDASNNSFPGDHATTAITFALFFAYLAPAPLRRWGITYGVIMAMPRMVLGAHWFSDVAIGSFSIALITFSWVFFTPFHERFVNYMTSRLTLRSI